MKKLHIIGLLLWRGGLLFAVGYGLFLSAKFALRMLGMWRIEVPDSLTTGIALVIAGFLAIMLSLILERIQDASREKDQQP
jgi:hypothetical protein